MCRTEKDRGVVRLNHRTAGIVSHYSSLLFIYFLGPPSPQNNHCILHIIDITTSSYCNIKIILITLGILAGIWPCGIITLISELFISESKTQVYGYLHSYLQDDPRTAERLSKLDTFLYLFLHNIVTINFHRIYLLR